MTSSGTTTPTAETTTKEGNWHPENLARITDTLSSLANQSFAAKPVAIFDFDNTCIFRDIGQAVFRFQVQHLRYRISPEELAAILPPETKELAGRPMAAIRATLLDAYRSLWPMIQAGQSLLARQKPTYPLFATLLLWCTDMARKTEHLGPRYVLPFMGKMLAGFTTAELRQLAQEVVEQVGKEPLVEERLAVEAPHPIGSISASYPLGLHAYPEMKALMDQLAAQGIERYVISASTEWLVEGAAPMLGFAVDADHIFGIRVRLADQERLTIDDVPAYPTTFREGKAQIILEQIKGTPVLVAGDADTDYEMLTLPGVPIRLLINRRQNGLIASLYQQPDILLQGIDLTRGCFRPSRDSISA
jgi:phosphoserine phosphatase